VLWKAASLSWEASCCLLPLDADEASSLEPTLRPIICWLWHRHEYLFFKLEVFNSSSLQYILASSLVLTTILQAVEKRHRALYFRKLPLVPIW
jgi:hypothetical protein